MAIRHSRESGNPDHLTGSAAEPDDLDGGSVEVIAMPRREYATWA